MYNEIMKRQTLIRDWSQSSLQSFSVSVLSKGRSAVVGSFLRHLAGLGVGTIRVVTCDRDFGPEAVTAAREVNPYVEIKASVVTAEELVLWRNDYMVSFEEAGRSPLKMIAGMQPNLTISLGDRRATLGNHDAATPAFLEAPGEPGVAAVEAQAEALVHVVRVSGALTSLRPMETAVFTSPRVDPGPWALFLLGCGALANSLLDALHISGLRPDVIYMVDSDTISLSNLNRQVLFRFREAGRHKSEVLASRARGLFPGSRIEQFPVAFSHGHLDQFVEASRPSGARMVAALVTDNWPSRVDGTAACRQRGIDLVYVGSSVTGAKVRVFGPSVPGSWCLKCSGEARTEPEDSAGGSCGRTPDASMVLPGIYGGARAVFRIMEWLKGEITSLGGDEIVLASACRLQDGARMAPCPCVASPTTVGTLVLNERRYPVMLETATTIADRTHVVGARVPGGGLGAVLLVPPGTSVTTSIGAEATTVALVLRNGERVLMGDQPVTFTRAPVAAAATILGATRCGFCFKGLGPQDVASICEAGHLVCQECSTGGCPYCEEDRV